MASVRPLEVEVRPPWPYRLPSRLGMDAVARRRGGVVSRLLAIGDERVVVHAWQPERARVRLRAVPADGHDLRSESLELALERMRFALAVDDDLSEFARTFRGDPLIGTPIHHRPWLRPKRRPWPWEALVWAITEQLIEARRAGEIQRRAVYRWGERLEPSEESAWRGPGPLRNVPSPETIAGLAPAELAAIDLAPKRASGRWWIGVPISGSPRKVRANSLRFSSTPTANRIRSTAPARGARTGVVASGGGGAEPHPVALGCQTWTTIARPPTPSSRLSTPPRRRATPSAPMRAGADTATAAGPRPRAADRRPRATCRAGERRPGTSGWRRPSPAARNAASASRRFGAAARRARRDRNHVAAPATIPPAAAIAAVRTSPRQTVTSALRSTAPAAGAAAAPRPSPSPSPASSIASVSRSSSPIRGLLYALAASVEQREHRVSGRARS